MLKVVYLINNKYYYIIIMRSTSHSPCTKDYMQILFLECKRSHLSIKKIVYF